MPKPVVTMHLGVCVRPKLAAWIVHLHFEPDGPKGHGYMEQEASGGYSGTTDNRIVLYGLIHGLERLHEPSRVTAVSDSGYAAKVLAKGFLDSWAARTDRGERSLFPDGDLWARLHGLLAVHEVVHALPAPDDALFRRMHDEAQVVAARRLPEFPRDEGVYVYIAY